MRKWRAGATPAEFKRIAPATRIYRTDEALDPSQGVALHTRDGLRPRAAASSPARAPRCSGPPGACSTCRPTRCTCGRRRERCALACSASRSTARAPSALKVARQPDRPVLVPRRRRRPPQRAGALRAAAATACGPPRCNAGDARAAARAARQLLRRPRQRAARALSALPTPGRATRSRTASSATTCSTARRGWRRPQALADPRVYAVRYARPDIAHEISLAHGVDRIEALGSDAVVVGSDGTRPALHQPAPRPRARSRAGPLHAAKRRAGRDAQPRLLLQADSAHEGLLGLPIIGRRPGRRARQLRHESAVAALPAQPAPDAAASSARSTRVPAGNATTAAALRASTGTATRGRSSSQAASSR